MISRLLNLLKNDERLCSWNVRLVIKNEYQLYYIGQKLQMNREVSVEEYYVTIFSEIINERQKKKSIGKASFQLYSTMSMDEIKEKIDEQVELSHYTLNQPFDFPKKADLKPISKEVRFDEHSLKDAAFIAADALFEADKFETGYLNSSEIFISCIETRFYDSNGNTFLNVKQVGNIEFVATWKKLDKEIELSKMIEFDHFDENYIHNSATQLLVEAANRIEAEKTPELGNVTVILKDEYAKTFFHHFVNKCKADEIYAHRSTYQVGQSLQESNEEIDLISIRLESIMKGSTKGAPFDHDGVALRRLHIIDNGTIKNLWGSNMKCQYINTPVTGCYDNFVVNAGSLTKEDLDDDTYLEIVALSDFDIDTITGEFGSEIRLAYLHSKSKETKKYTGGSISGNIYEIMDHLRFSKETVQINNYVGPKAVLLPNIKVTKGQ